MSGIKGPLRISRGQNTKSRAEVLARDNVIGTGAGASMGRSPI